MKSTLKFSTFLLLWVLLLHISCKKEEVQVIAPPPSPSSTNRPPVANAGADQTIILPVNAVTLNGSGSTDPDNNITGYVWTKISGPSRFTIVNSITAQTSITGLVLGTYEFELKVTDGGGLFSKDTVLITVNNNSGNSAHWTSLGFLDATEFFFGSRFWFNGSNFFMGINGKLFVVSNKGGLWQYDPHTNTWYRNGIFPEQMASVPVVFSSNNKGYCIGNGHCWQYDAATNQWVRKSDVPNYIAGGAVPLAINNKVYLESSTNNHVMAYDPVADSYTQKNNFPVAGAATGFVINGEGYCIGGDGKCWKYDVATDNWKQKTSLPSSVFASMTGFTLNNSGYIIGDLGGNAYNLNYPMKVWRYDPLLNQWNQDEDYPGYGAYEINTVSFNGIVYAGIGYNTGDFNATDFWKFQ